jgi:hypothetical protein
MWSIGITLVLVILIPVHCSSDCPVFGDCGPYLGGAKLVFHNRTDSHLCYDSSSLASVSDKYCNNVKANGKSVWRPECMSGAGLNPNYVKGGLLRVVLAKRDTGGTIYDDDARCDEETTFVIDHDGDDFVITKAVTDPLPDQPATARP